MSGCTPNAHRHRKKPPGRIATAAARARNACSSIDPTQGNETEPAPLARSCWAPALLTEAYRGGPAVQFKVRSRIPGTKINGDDLLALAPTAGLDQLAQFRKLAGALLWGLVPGLLNDRWVPSQVSERCGWSVLLVLAQFGQFAGEFVLAALEVGEFLADLAGAESPAELRSGVERGDHRNRCRADFDAGGKQSPSEIGEVRLAVDVPAPGVTPRKARDGERTLFPHRVHLPQCGFEDGPLPG